MDTRYLTSYHTHSSMQAPLKGVLRVNISLSPVHPQSYDVVWNWLLPTKEELRAWKAGEHFAYLSRLVKEVDCNMVLDDPKRTPLSHKLPLHTVILLCDAIDPCGAVPPCYRTVAYEALVAHGWVWEAELESLAGGKAKLW